MNSLGIIFRQLNTSTYKSFLELVSGTGKGYILLPTLRRVLTSLGEKMSTEEVDSFIKDMDIQDDDKIPKDKFLQAFDIANWN